MSQPVTGYEKLIIAPGNTLQGTILLTSQIDTISTVSLYGSVKAFTIYSKLEGVPLYNLTGNTLTVMVAAGDTVNITYFSQLSGDPLTLYVKGWNQSLELYIHANYVILGVEPIPDLVLREGNFTVFRYNRLEEDLSLSAMEVPVAEEKTGTYLQGKTWIPVQLVFAAIAIILVLVVVLLLILRRGRNKKSTFLSEEEEAIIDFLRKNGGKAYLKDLRESLGIPSTTLLRRVRRLEEKGLVKTLRAPGGLIVQLT
ncbi:helix-turn-helix transcriptional regulator [Infirmifilum uzonense]|uniref:helix-turn-helix transcriptional regulator n=1 Tax=Infirmifilum uzonense TaxID=1550241 RepID=UPI003C7636AF